MALGRPTRVDCRVAERIYFYGFRRKGTAGRWLHALLGLAFGASFISGVGLAEISEPIQTRVHPVARLAWAANSETNLVGYRLYFGFSPERLYFSTNVGLVTNAVLNLPIGDETYYFAATAQNSDLLESEFSEVVSNWFSLGAAVTVTNVSLNRVQGIEGNPVPLMIPDSLWSAVEWTLVEPPRNGVIEGTAPDLMFIPNPGFSGTDRFRFSLNLGFGQVMKVTGDVEVLPVNDPPVAIDDEVVTQVGVPIQIMLLATDPEGSQLTYRITKYPVHGDMDVQFPVLLYRPHNIFSGLDTLEFVANDGQNDSQTGKIDIYVEEEVSLEDELLLSEIVDEDRPLDLVLNAPATGYPPFSYNLMESSDDLILEVGTPNLRYVPPTNFNGTVQFNYRVTDSNDLTLTGRVEILVRPVNDPPLAIPSSVTVRAAKVEPLPIDGFDVDGDTLTFEIVEKPVHGELLIKVDGIFYLANSSFVGQDELVFKASDGILKSAPVSCRINVLPWARLAVPTTLEMDTAGKPNLRLTWETVPGVRYVVVRSQGLGSSSWQRLGEPDVAEGTEMTVLIPIEEGSAAGYFAVELPDLSTSPATPSLGRSVSALPSASLPETSGTRANGW
jgi:hypothetical protein